MNAIEVVRYEREHKDAVVELWQHAFGANTFDQLAYFEWKYEQNPYLSDPVLFLARDGKGRVVGTRGFYGGSWHTSVAKSLVPCADDYAIASEYRSTGLAAEIMRAALEGLEQGFEYVLNASGGPSTVLQSLAMGWKSVGAMEPAARFRAKRARSPIRDVVAKGARWLPRPRGARRSVSRSTPTTERLGRGSPYEHLDRVGREPVAEGEAAIVVESSPRAESMAGLVARLQDDGRIRHARDAPFFTWRFANPSREYRFLVYEVAGRIDGYLVIGRPRSRQLSKAPFHIADWEGASPQIRARLLECALFWGRFDNIRAWTASLGADEKFLLAQSGFEPTQLDLRARGMPCVLLKKLSAAGTWSIGEIPALDSSHWDIRLIDSMHG